MHLAATLALFAVTQALPNHYPFAPFSDPEDAQAVARLERRLAKPDGIGVAVELNCEDDWGGGGYDIDELVAREFLIRRFERALPALLERVRRERAPNSSDHARLCGAGARSLIGQAVCFGYATGASGPSLDAHPQAVTARARVAEAFVAALESKRLPTNLLLDVLLEALDSGRAGRAYSLTFEDLCTGGKALVYRATRPLLETLGAPKKLGQPPRPFVAEGNQEKAFRLLSYGVANRWLAEAKVRPFLEHPATLPLAAVTLERMGVDASAVVPHLEQTLDALTFSGKAKADGAAFALLEDSFDLFVLLGPRGNAALPSLGRVAARWELPECRWFGTRFYVDVIRATYVRGQEQNSLAVLLPLLRCPDPLVRALPGTPDGPAAR